MLNSPVADFAFRKGAKPKEGGYYEANKQFIAPLPIPKATGEGRRLLGGIARDLSAEYFHRRMVLQRTHRRISVDLLGGRPLSRNLASWPNSNFELFREELVTRYRVDIPLGDRDDWDKYLTKARDEYQRDSRQIAALEVRLRLESYRLYSLSSDEIAVVER